MAYALITLDGATPFNTTDASAVCAPTAPGAMATVDEIEAAATIRKTFSTETGTSNAYMNVALTPMRAAYEIASTPTTCTMNLRGCLTIAPPSLAFSQVRLKRRQSRRTVMATSRMPPATMTTAATQWSASQPKCTSNDPATPRNSHR